MSGINKTITVGYLGADPDVKQFNDGGMVANLSVAVSAKWNDQRTGEKKEHTEWIRWVLRNRLAEVSQQYLRKGSLVYLEGYQRTRKYTDSNGIERYTTENIATNMQMLGGQGNQQSNNQGYQQPQNGGIPPNYNQNNGNPQAMAMPQQPVDNDIPF